MDPRNFVYLSDQGSDEYINMLAVSSGGSVTSTENFDYDHSDQPIVLRGILKYKLMQRCLIDSRDFYYVDTGYLQRAREGKSNKLWHRIVKNDLQHNHLIQRNDNRFKRMGISLPKKRLFGSRIVIAAPDEKPCRAYGIELDSWIESTVETLKQHTDREIVIRRREKSRVNRMLNNSLKSLLHDNIHALVTFNSNAATESILQGVPAFVLAPSHAARPVANDDLSQIESPFWPDSDLLYQWCCHLSYCQVHVRELQNSNVWKILQGIEN